MRKGVRRNARQAARRHEPPVVARRARGARRCASRPAPARRCSRRSTRRSPAAATSTPRAGAAGCEGDAVRGAGARAARRRRRRRDPLRRAPDARPARRARGARAAERRPPARDPGPRRRRAARAAGGRQRPRPARGRRAAERRPRIRRAAGRGPRRRGHRGGRGGGRADRAATAAHRPAARPARPRDLAAARSSKATTVIAHAGFLTEGLREHATIVFPAESYAEKEGTVTHPDGRLQRLRRAIGRQGETRAEWQVLAEISKALGADPGVLTSSMVTQQVMAAVPFYAGLTLDLIGGDGLRWTEREQAAAHPAGDARAGRARGAAERRAGQRPPAPGDLPLDLGGARRSRPRRR